MTTITQPYAAKYLITGTFKITGWGLVLAGHITEGRITSGDMIEFRAFDQLFYKRITGVEGMRTHYQDKTNTGLLIKCENEAEIDKLRSWEPDNEVALIFNTNQ